MKKAIIITVVLVLVLFIVTLVGLWYLGGKSLAEKETEIDYQKLATTDSDQDGLKDWEEVLWQTVIDDADTDKDGVSDGLEISRGSDPRDPNPQAKITDPDERALMLARREKENVVETGEPNTFSEESLVISQSNETALIESYRDNLVDGWLEFSGKTSGQETKLLLNYIDTGDPSLILSLNQSKEAYKNWLKKLLTQPVPKNAVFFHLKLVNQIDYLEKLISRMTNVDNSPNNALAAAAEYLKQTSLFDHYLNNIKIYLALNKLDFN